MEIENGARCSNHLAIKWSNFDAFSEFSFCCCLLLSCNYIELLVFYVFQEMRRRRNEVSVELRKAKKEEQLFKKRNLNFAEEEILQEAANSPKAYNSIEDIVIGKRRNLW